MFLIVHSLGNHGRPMKYAGYASFGNSDAATSTLQAGATPPGSRKNVQSHASRSHPKGKRVKPRFSIRCPFGTVWAQFGNSTAYFWRISCFFLLNSPLFVGQSTENPLKNSLVIISNPNGKSRLNPANTNEYVVFQTVSSGQLRFLV